MKTKKWIVAAIGVLLVVAMCWMLGGGAAVTPVKKDGLNMELPPAILHEQATDKMSFYAVAQQDSVKRMRNREMDPVYQPVVAEKPVVAGGAAAAWKPVNLPVAVERESSPELDRLQEMLQHVSQRTVDPDIAALNETLDKLAELQQPKAVRAVYKSPKALAVHAGPVTETSYFGRVEQPVKTGFYSEDFVNADSGTAIRAVIHGDQVLQAGSVVKMRLLQDLWVGGMRIVAGAFVFGLASLDGDRMKIAVGSVVAGQQLMPVSLSVYDIDGMEGVYVPSSIGQEVKKQSAEQAIQSAGIGSFDPSLKGQVAAAGINAAKNLFSKKTQSVRVTVRAGYNVLLK